jgi:hypothetical protein
MDLWQIITSNAAAISTVLALIALIVTIFTQVQQRQLTRSLHAQQTLLQQRQLLLPMWEYLDRTSFLNPSAPVWEDVRKTANTLELVAVCWEGGLIDPDIIRRIFADTFIELYESVEQCQNPPPTFPLDGRALLRRSPATQRLYDELRQERINQGRIPAMTNGRKRT